MQVQFSYFHCDMFVVGDIFALLYSLKSKNRSWQTPRKNTALHFRLVQWIVKYSRPKIFKDSLIW